MDFKLEIARLLQVVTGMECSAFEDMLEVPPNAEMGDYALPCFKLSKTLKQSPPAIAQQLSGKLREIEQPDFLQEIQTQGGYLNFFLNKQVFAKQVVNQVLQEGERYGSSKEGQGRTICLDFSSINIAKPFHIGHLSTTVIGQALANIYQFLGYKTVSINHLGDWGTQFGKLIVAYQLWGNKEAIESGGVREMLKIYVKFHEEAEKDHSLDDQARAWFKKIEEGDAQALALFHWFKALTLKEVGRVYELLGVTFDSYNGESFYNDKMDSVIDLLKEKDLLVEDQGASVVKFENDEMPPCLILKADGATLYATRDLAAAIYRKENYDFYKSLYVVAYQQNLHFKQVFKVLSMMDFEWAKDCEHVAFGMVSMEEGTLSTRQGKIIFLEDVLNKSIEKSHELIAQKNPGLENKEEVAKAVGVGAIVFNALSASRIKDICFSWDRVLTFEGETGPYCQYTYARCCSVLNKVDGFDAEHVDYACLKDSYAQDVIKNLASFGQNIKNACTKNEPSIITRSVLDLCQAFNKFYFENRILGESPEIMNARLALTNATRTVIKTGLGLIGVSVVEQM